MTDLVEALKQEIEETEQLLIGLKALLRSKEGRTASPASTSTETLNPPTFAETGAINLAELELPATIVKKKPTLGDDVMSVIDRLGTQEFSVAQVDAVLRQLGKGSAAKHFKNRVSALIRKLTDDGVLERTHKGVGSDPHRYRKATKVSLVKSGSN